MSRSSPPSSVPNESDVLIQETPLPSSKQLFTSIHELLERVTQEHHERVSREIRSEESSRDMVLEAINAEINEGRPKHITNWKKIEVMSREEIVKETETHLKKYEGRRSGSSILPVKLPESDDDSNMCDDAEFWKEHESTPRAVNATEDAYTSAFERFPEIYDSLGWRYKEDLSFNAVNLSEYRERLVESIFAVEAYRSKFFGQLRDLSRASFESSRLPRLLIILVRIESRQNYGNECSRSDEFNNDQVDAPTTLRVLCEVGRTMRSISFADGLNKMTLEELLVRCYSRQILQQPGPEDFERQHQHFLLLFDCLTALDFIQRFREIRDTLSGTFYARYKSEPLYRFLDMVKRHRELTRSIEYFKPLPLRESESPTFFPTQFNIKYLQQFGNLEIEWTNCLDEHLKIYAGRNAIRVFAHPTFFYNFVDLHKKERDYHEPTFRELSFTYALLFRPSSRCNLNRLHKFTGAGKVSRLPWHKCVTFLGHQINRATRSSGRKHHTSTEKMNIDPGESPTRYVLENFYRCSLPPAIQAAFAIAQPTATIRKIEERNQDKVTSAPMFKVLELSPHYPEDVAFMIISVFERELQNREDFQLFPYFGPRLRQLQTYLDSQQPRGFLQFWRDDRDARSWWTFWLFLSFVCLSLLSSFVGIGLQIVHTTQCR